MKSFDERKHTLYIALALAIGHAVPLYAYSLGLFDILLSQFFFPAIGDIVALTIAIAVHGQGVDLRLTKWISRLTLLTLAFYLLLLIGSFFVGQRQYGQWNVFAIITLPFAASWFLLMSVVTGLIIRRSKE